MICIMNGDRMVAHLDNSTGFPMMVAEPDATITDLPMTLFGFGHCAKREVTYEVFLKWAMKRCPPEERMDIKEVLKTLGLKKYDRYDIIKRTNAELTGVDNFWVDFGEGRIEIK